jgi:hypothetical protein
MEQKVFIIFIDYRGHHLADIKICNAAIVNLHQKTFVSKNKNEFLNTTERLKIGKNVFKKSFILFEICSAYLFRAAPYKLMLVLNKDALLHSNCHNILYPKSNITILFKAVIY